MTYKQLGKLAIDYQCLRSKDKKKSQFSYDRVLSSRQITQSVWISAWIYVFKGRLRDFCIAFVRRSFSILFAWGNLTTSCWIGRW
mmetsp:Transcript_30092/g.41945  ORF Transcript_30092/g.41945 Transcript_30092/m.41945 type:complete len:85 (-) Transcript_30092:216-470(-)